MTYLAIGRTVTIACDSCGFKFQGQCNADYGAAIRALGWETFETDRCPTCVEAKRRLDEEDAFSIIGAHMGISQDTEDFLICSDEHSAWRGPNGRGYTPDPANAGRYTRDAAIKTCRNALPVDFVTLVAFPEIIVREAHLMAYQDLVRRRKIKISRGKRVYEDRDEGLK
jgi:hypothetical protein